MNDMTTGSSAAGLASPGTGPATAVRSGRRRSRTAPRDRGLERVATFLVAVLVPLGLALRGGGSALIERQQFALGLWAVLLIGFLFGILPRARLPRVAAAPITIGLALVGWLALGLLWTESVERTLDELARLVGYLGIATLVLATVHARNWRAAAVGLLSGGAIVCMLALASRFAPDFVDWGSVSTLGQERLNYPLEYWNALAFIAVTTLVLGFGLGCNSGKSVRPLALAVTPLAGLVLYLTFSRGGVLAAIAGTVVLGLLVPDLRRLLVPVAVCSLSTAALVILVRSQPELANGTGGEGGAIVAAAALAAAVACGRSSRPAGSYGGGSSLQPSRGRPLALALLGVALVAALAAVAVAFSGPDAPTGTEGELSGERNAPDPAARLISITTPRYELWSSALAGFADDPVTGSGAGTFSYQWDGDGRGDDLVVDSHSLFLDALVETGLPGTAALIGALVALGLLASSARRTARHRRDKGALGALIAAFVAFCLHAGIDWLWEVPAAGVLGLSTVLVAVSSVSRPSPGGRLGTWSTSLAVVACLAAIAVQVPGLVSEDRIETSRKASRAGQDHLAIELATDAVEAAPWFAGPYAQRAEVELSALRLAAAQADAGEAVEREPLEWRHAMLSARIALASGDEPAAIAALDRVAELRPASRRLVAALQERIRSGDRRVLAPFDPS